MFIATSFALGACGTQNRFSGNADALLQAYMTKIEAEGYTYNAKDEKVPEKDTPELMKSIGMIYGPSGGFSGAVYVQIEETTKGVRSVTLSFDPDPNNQNIDQVNFLSGTLMQVYDSANGSGKAAAIRRAKAVIAAADKAQVYEKNGCAYSMSLYSTGIDFEAVLPSENYALSAKELAKMQGRTWSDLGVAKSDFIKRFNAIFDEYGYSLEGWDARYGDLDLERTDLLAVQPDIFAIMNQAGFVDGALLLYYEGETVYRVELAETSSYAFYLNIENEAKLLISCFDSTMEGEAAATLMDQISKLGSVEQNGIAYSYLDSPFDKIFVVEAAQP